MLGVCALHFQVSAKNTLKGQEMYVNSCVYLNIGVCLLQFFGYLLPNWLGVGLTCWMGAGSHCISSNAFSF